MGQANYNSSDYFMQVIANLQTQITNLSTSQRLPIVTYFNQGPISTTSTSPVTLSAATQTVALGISGDAVVTICANMFFSAASQVGVIQGTIDGTPITGGITFGGTSTFLTASVSAFMRLSSVGQSTSQGLHQFGLVYYSQNGGSLQLENIGLQILPV